MEIKIAEVCGLCAGCKRAIFTAQELLALGEQVTIFKEIVHNENVNASLKNLGANFEDDIEKLSSKGFVVIRAHGEPPATYDFFKEKNISYRDCTCFNVEKIHNLVKEYYGNNYKIVIIGKHKPNIHPEVFGTFGWANNEAIIVQDEFDLKKLEDVDKDIYLVCQTTFNIAIAEELILKIKQIAKNKGLQLIVNNSICASNKLINQSSRKLAKDCDVMIVVGGKNSSNTKELYNNLKNVCPTVFVENIHNYKSALEENKIKINKNTKIGITAGASTMKEELEVLRKMIIEDFAEKTSSLSQ